MLMIVFDSSSPSLCFPPRLASLLALAASLLSPIYVILSCCHGLRLSTSTLIVILSCCQPPAPLLSSSSEIAARFGYVLLFSFLLPHLALALSPSLFALSRLLCSCCRPFLALFLPLFSLFIYVCLYNLIYICFTWTSIFLHFLWPYVFSSSILPIFCAILLFLFTICSIHLPF